jgi:hypothetical protein
MFGPWQSGAAAPRWVHILSSLVFFIPAVLVACMGAPSRSHFTAGIDPEQACALQRAAENVLNRHGD